MGGPCKPNCRSTADRCTDCNADENNIEHLAADYVALARGDDGMSGRGDALDEQAATVLWGPPKPSGNAGDPKTLVWNCGGGIGRSVAPAWHESVDAVLDTCGPNLSVRINVTLKGPVEVQVRDPKLRAYWVAMADVPLGGSRRRTTAAVTMAAYLRYHAYLARNK